MTNGNSVSGRLFCFALFASVCVAVITGCAGVSHGIKQISEGKDGRYLLYDQYVTYLGRKDAALKDSFVFGVSTDENIVCITFDDGPSKNTDRIISILKKLDCPAAFFIIAENVMPETRAQYEGSLFEKGIHGYKHENVFIYSDEECMREVGKARITFEIFGMKTKYFRPPYGAITDGLKNALAENRLEGILWNVDSLDWAGLSGQDLVNRVVSNAGKGDIILFHEIPWTADALEQIVTGIRQRGFRIVSLSELLKNPKIKPPNAAPNLHEAKNDEKASLLNK